MTKVAESLKRNVYPSPADFATASAPIVEPAPGRFSTITGCLQASERRCATLRATASTPPPGGKGTIIRTGLIGYGCACVQGTAMMNAAATSTQNNRVVFRVTGPSYSAAFL